MGCDWRCQNLNSWVFWMNQIQIRQCCQKVENGRKVAGAIRSLVKVRGFQLKCSRVLHETMFRSVIYGSET